MKKEREKRKENRSVTVLGRPGFLSETNRFENDLERDSKQKLIHIVLMWMVENGQKLIKMKTMSEIS